MSKIIAILVIFFLFSCQNQNHKMYYNVGNQELISCNESAFRMIGLDDGKNSFSLFWSDSVIQPPVVLSLNSIPKGYTLKVNGLRVFKPFKLSSNKEYTIEKSGAGLNSHMIRIWTDKTGRVYKTTHPNCDCPDGVPVEWVK